MEVKIVIRLIHNQVNTYNIQFQVRNKFNREYTEYKYKHENRLYVFGGYDRSETHINWI